MALDPITAGIETVKDIGGALIRHFFPDPAQQAAAEQKLAELETSGELQQIAGQLAINQEEAKSPNWFIAGWRPAAGWVGVISLALVYWPKAIALTVLWCFQAYHAVKLGFVIPPYPDLGLTDILGLLGSLLGIGTMRSVEKIKGAEGNR